MALIAVTSPSRAAQRRRRAAAVAALLFAAAPSHALALEPVYVGLDLEFSHRTSTTPEAIRRGVLVAIDEINGAGGVLHGRPLRVVERDNHAIPARAVENARELASRRDLVAVFCGKFGPTALEQVATIHELKLPMLDAWAAADLIVDNGYRPNYVFRLALKDAWAMPAMLAHAARRGYRSVGVLLPNTSWGRSNENALEAYLARSRHVKVVARRRFNVGDTTLVPKYDELRHAGAEAVVAVAAEEHGAMLIREVAALPPERRLPIISHQGMVGGDLVALAGPALREVDLTIVQPFSFVNARGPRARRVSQSAERLFGVRDLAAVPSQAGMATAYDLTHILARAVELAGSTDRVAIRDALEHVTRYAGLIKTYHHPFTPTRHEALSPSDVTFVRFDDGGVPVPVGWAAP